jgi:hypothetical protein
MLLNLVRHVRNRDIQRRIVLAAVLLSGGTPFIACVNGPMVPTPPTLDCSGTDCDPPVQGLHDPKFHAGATVSLRTPAAADNGVTLFARTGVLAPIDNASSVATPPLPGGVAPSGTAFQRENIALPLYGGVTIPVKNVGVPIPNLSLEAFGGANIKKEKIGFSLNEDTGGVASASRTYWTANPAAGAGIQYYLGTLYGVPASLGAAYIVDFQRSDHSVTAVSPTVVGQSYTLTNHSHISQTAAFTLNFDLAPK